MLVRVLFLFLALLAAGVATANPVNLALRRPTAQSSTMEGKDGYSSAKGVDGRKYDSSLFHTEMEDNPWWEVDLGAEYAIDNVTLYNRVGCCQERIAGAQVLLSSDAVNYLLIAKLGNESFRNRRVDVGGLTARFVRIQLPGRQYLHLQEVEVYQYGTWQPPSKRATGQRVRVTQPGPWTVDTTGKSTTRTTTSARGAAIEGQWSVNFNNYRGTMWFTRSGSGWTGRLTLGGAAEEALTNITLDEATGRITFLRPRANQQYTGTWNGDSMSGRFDNRYNWSATRQGTGTAATSASSSTTKAATASSPTTKSSTASSSTTKTATANPATRVTTSARSTAIEGQWSVNFNGHRGTMWFTRSGSGWTGRLTLGGAAEEALTNITLDEATGRIAFLRPRANQQYTGTWNGNAMSGRFDNRYNWSATR